MKPKVTYLQLQQELERLGWKAEPLELDSVGGTFKTQNTIFQHPKTDLYILLPRMTQRTIVDPIYLLRIRLVMENAGFWDALVRQNGTEIQEQATPVLQTLAGIKR